mmetsp:Transcript_31030/g.52404  ORF Transcript_31030/g.52404 Transcript_31030/m.52404 type:complete len:84 (+) Transcript_31030:244-495(+)
MIWDTTPALSCILCSFNKIDAPNQQHFIIHMLATQNMGPDGWFLGIVHCSFSERWCHFFFQRECLAGFFAFLFQHQRCSVSIV